jgi:hypothetical protein
MNKYYIQSGDIKMIILARDQKDACLKVITKYANKEIMISSSFVVSERGFVLDREPFSMDTEEIMLSSENLIREYKDSIDL